MSKIDPLTSLPQERILLSAMGEFALKGYERASTNQIIKAAKTSKGLLFHYFENKQQLYESVFDYCTNLLLKQFYYKLQSPAPDIFARIIEMTKLKLELIYQFPEVFAFFEQAALDTSLIATNKFKGIQDELRQQLSEKILAAFDPAPFRDSIDPTKALEIVMWSLDGISKKFLLLYQTAPEGFDYLTAVNHSIEYLDLLRRAFYKEESYE